MMESNNQLKILIIRMSSIGDIVLTTPLLRILEKKWPYCEIDFVVKKQFESLIEHNTHIRNVIAFQKGSTNSSLRAVKRHIRNEKYDIILDIHNNFRSRWLCWNSNAKSVKRFRKYIFHRFLLIHFQLDIYKSIIPVYQRYLATLNLQYDQLGLDIFFPNDLNSKILNVIADHNLDSSRNIIGLAPGASYATKRWPEKYFQTVAQSYAARENYNVLLFGDKSDRSVCRAIKQNNRNIIDLSGQYSILETALWMNLCRMVICNDSGLMHIASALKKPVIAIFGSTTEHLGFYPGRSKSIVIENENLSCRPCSHVGRHKCPQEHFRCMNDISPERVMNAIRLLESQQQYNKQSRSISI